MNPPFYHGLRVGMLGGGQLGRMLIQAAVDYNLHIRVLDPAADAPCRPYAHAFVQGDLMDYDTVMRFGQDCDLLTIEIEHVHAGALAALQAAGKIVRPDPSIIRLIQDKREQKLFFRQYGFPSAPFRLTETAEDVEAFAEALPLVQKLARAGYDGRGVQILRSRADLSRAFDAPGLLEDYVPFAKELAVIASRNPQGETVVYPVVEMQFHPEHNLVEYLFAPADIPPHTAHEAQQLARRVLHDLNYTGTMAVELFLTEEGGLLINELAPRPHNSGHHTIRACYTSQYENHLRTILGLAPGDPAQHTPAAMVNLLGAPGHSGPARYAGIEEALRMPGVYPHLYGKSETRPFRKMGHVTLIDPDPARLHAKAVQVKALIQVISA